MQKNLAVLDRLLYLMQVIIFAFHTEQVIFVLFRGGTFQSAELDHDRRRIVIAEDHSILREGLRMLLSSNPDFEWWARQRTASRRFAWSKPTNRPDPDGPVHPRMNGMGAIQEIKKQCPRRGSSFLPCTRPRKHPCHPQGGGHGYILKTPRTATDAGHRPHILGKKLSQPGISRRSSRDTGRKETIKSSTPGHPHAARARDTQDDRRRLQEQGHCRLPVH